MCPGFPCKRPAQGAILSGNNSHRVQSAGLAPGCRWVGPAVADGGSTVSRSVNKIILVGNVGSDPDVRVTSAGVKVARVSLATNWRTGGEEPEERTDWHRVNLWGRLAQVTEDYVSKGDKLYVEGYLQYDSYERDGVTIPTAEIRAREMIMLSSRDGQ
ncbi:MAG: single-stranded DNA-binding protein [Gemmatimonadetes bacterium]|nr:single-stranded DNA-binding protein [Gemmatimonadota bacterium]MYA65007.1 single-stranded DNA-binding protein [Gemmatimonadota bacterium]MYC00026.1 single-stranded DNA-binding protein [Gemmatimonadota bacterium]MYH54403.1 single-stranded DNA-binding protein [Gemmatimonadota bacterium]MYI45286.1 single-stranded DNA-binding protein [Gemmatimonadota bacterium]